MSESSSHRSLVTVSALLAGFSFTAVMGLLRIPAGSKSFEIAFISFLLATFLFLALVIGGWAADDFLLEHEPSSLDKAVFYKATIPMFLAALVAFSVGASATAFLPSVIAGIVAVCAALGLLTYLLVTTVEVAYPARAEANQAQKKGRGFELSGPELLYGLKRHITIHTPSRRHP
jgi:hypothetical protein